MGTLRNDLIKLAYEQPHFRDAVIGLLRIAAAPSGGEGAESEEEAATPKKRKGPPPRWDEFLKAKYNGGKKKVSNPNSKTRTRFPQVSASTAMKDKGFFKKVMEEYKKWAKSTLDKSKSSPPTKSETGKPKAPKETVSTPKFSLPEDRFVGKRVYLDFVKNAPREEVDVANPGRMAPMKLGQHELDIQEVMDLVGASTSKSIDTGKVTIRSDYIDFRAEQTDDVDAIHRNLHVDNKGQIYVYNESLFLKKSAPKGLGTRIFANQVAKARQMGNVSSIKCLAWRSDYDDPDFGGYGVGYKVWPKMGYDGEIPASVIRDLPSEIQDKFKAAGLAGTPMVSWFYKVKGGEEWWSENGRSFDATFDLTPGSKSLEVHDKYVAKKAKEAGQTVEEFMTKTAAAKGKGKKDDAKGKPGKGDNVTLDESDHKILDEIWKSMRR